MIGLNKNIKNVNFDDYGSRSLLSDRLLKIFWPNHTTYFVENEDYYNNIEDKLLYHTENSDKKDIIILQTEEDWFYEHDVIELRKDIAVAEPWTNNSFLITNSNWDNKISNNYIKSYYKPGILDLISYTPYSMEYSSNLLKFSEINFHTSMIYRSVRTGREETFNTLYKHKEKCSILHYNQSKFVNIAGDHGGSDHFGDAPFVHIEHDKSWARYTAFITSIETFNIHSTEGKFLKFIPTLSEKTFKAMHLMRPALILGGPGVRDTLKSFGFDTWDWLIDWSFDYETDYEKAFHMYLDELNRLLNIDIVKLRHILFTNRNKLIYNRRRIFSLINNYSRDF